MNLFPAVLIGRCKWFLPDPRFPKQVLGPENVRNGQKVKKSGFFALHSRNDIISSI